MFLWVKNVLNVFFDFYEKNLQFVDRYVFCLKSGVDLVLVNYQIYRYVKMCMKKNKFICCFNFLIFFMFKIVILFFLEDEVVLLEVKVNY